MSPRAACRLEQLGFPEVYDYTAGKADWLAHGLETEGEQAGVLRARHAVRADVVTASIQELVTVMRDKNLTVMLVTTPEGRLLGVLPRDLAEHTLNADGRTR